MDDFYMVIPSNVPSVTGEKNKISSFKNYLPRAITLDRSKWRVALVQIDYPFSWTNISGDVGELVLSKGRLRLRASIPPKYYSTADELLTAINRVLDRADMKTRFYEESAHVCRIKMGRNEAITLHPTLAGILGFNEIEFTSHHPDIGGNSTRHSDHIATYFSDYIIDLRASFYNMYVYSDLVSESVVGNTYVPLLQTVPIHANRAGDLIHHEFINPQYIRLQTGSITSIQIQLCDERGNLVQFEKGHVIVKLHFKRYDG